MVLRNSHTLRKFCDIQMTYIAARTHCMHGYPLKGMDRQTQSIVIRARGNCHKKVTQAAYA